MNIHQKERLLIIDDDEDFGLRAKQTLNSAGFRAYFHSGARGALEAYRQRSYDVVLLDVNMPEIDGPHLLRMLRDSCVDSTVRVVLCSNMHPSALQKLARRFGADHWMEKPVDIGQLVPRLRSILLAEPTNRTRAKRSSVPPVSGVRETLEFKVPTLAVPPPLVTIASGITIEPPDIVVLGAQGCVVDEHVTEWLKARPYYLVLLDMSQTVDLTIAVRGQLGTWAKHMPPHAIAAFGMSFHGQVVFEMIQRAVSRLCGHPLRRHFARDEATARNWLDEVRRERQACATAQLRMHDDTSNECLGGSRVG